MIQVEIFGKSIVAGKIGGRFRYCCTKADRPVRFKNLVFRAHPSDRRLTMARVYKYGYDIHIECLGDVYTARVYKDGRECCRDHPCRSCYKLYSEPTLDAFLVYVQRVMKRESESKVKQCLPVVNGVHSALIISYLRLSLYVNKIKDKAIWQH